MRPWLGGDTYTYAFADVRGYGDVYNAMRADWLANVVFTYIDDAGHYPMHETPVRFATVLEGHFAAN